MQRISSQMTFFYKRVIPIIWFGFIALSLATPLVRFLFRLPASVEPLPFLVAPAFMAIVGYFIMRKVLFDLVDEVLDGGDALIIRNRGIEERLPLAYIINVNYAPLTSPPRVTLACDIRTHSATWPFARRCDSRPWRFSRQIPPART